MEPFWSVVQAVSLLQAFVSVSNPDTTLTRSNLNNPATKIALSSFQACTHRQNVGYLKNSGRVLNFLSIQIHQTSLNQERRKPGKAGSKLAITLDHNGVTTSGHLGPALIRVYLGKVLHVFRFLSNWFYKSSCFCFR